MFGKLENGFLTLSAEKRLGFKPINECVPQSGTGKFVEYIDRGDYIEKVYESIDNNTYVRLQDLEQIVQDIVEKIGLTEVKPKFKKDKNK